MRMKHAISLLQALALMPAWAPLAVAQSPEKNAAVYRYEGSDRTQRLVAGARQEGKLVVYTSLATSESVPLAAAFEKKYGVKVELWRSLSDQVGQRVLNEARARRHIVDVVETNGPVLEALARERVLGRFSSPHIADIPAWGVPAHGLWVADRVDFFVVAFNTTKVRREDLPAGYEGFLDPKWKGKIGLEATDQEWLFGLARHWGEKRALDFFDRLVAMKPDVRKGHVLLSELVAAGEVPVSLTNYASNADSMKRRDKPIDWKPVEPVIGRPQALGLAASAPHPNAALLFSDFVLSPEGQQLFDSMGRFPANQKVKSRLGNFPFVMLDPVVLVDEDEKWLKLWDRLTASR
ncbi:MAG TPA: extracellular solute-binding protein [Burkholderiales bacterium]|nr:extracellular solute-binding protein [Burkholderiales bacterium]